MRLAILLCCLGLLLGGVTHAAECSVSSGTERVALLELYTSEGCSSCPPADRWLSRMRNVKNVVPLAWHVDYWDHLGWRDRFAQPAYSARQRELARLNGQSFVYTPQVVLNGRDFRAWRKNGALEQAINQQQRTVPARLSLSVRQQAPDRLAFTVRAQAVRSGPNALFVAVYQNGLTSQVRQGENAGHVLHHDFVVRAWRGPYPLAAQSETLWQQDIPLPQEDAQPAGVVAFMQNTATGEILQTVALPLCTD